jgi:hypothetical protein
MDAPLLPYSCLYWIVNVADVLASRCLTMACLIIELFSRNEQCLSGHVTVCYIGMTLLPTLQPVRYGNVHRRARYAVLSLEENSLHKSGEL